MLRLNVINVSQEPVCPVNQGSWSFLPEELLGDTEVRGEELFHLGDWRLPYGQGPGLSHT